MTINTEPTMPGYLWAERPMQVPTWAAAPTRQPWGPPTPPTPGPVRPWNAAPPAAAAPGWPQPMPPRPTSRRRWLPIAMVTSVAVLAAGAGLATALAKGSAGGAATASVPAPSTPIAPPPPPPLVHDESLPALLLDPAAVNAVMGTTTLEVVAKLSIDRLYSDTTDRPECGGVWANANKGVYAGSGWQGVRTLYLREPGRSGHEVYESVISFPTAEAATAFAAKEAKSWQACVNSTLTTTNPSFPAQTWFVASVNPDADVLTSTANREGAGGYGCQHALTARNNVVADVSACGDDVTQQGSTIAHRIAEHISRSL